MKPLRNQGIREKVQLMHELLPENIRGLVNFIETTCDNILSDPNAVQNLGLTEISINEIQQWAITTKTIIEENRETLIADASFFILYLITPSNMNFIVFCMGKYSEHYYCPENFAKAISIFIGQYDELMKNL